LPENSTPDVSRILAVGYRSGIAAAELVAGARAWSVLDLVFPAALQGKSQ
jgi:hypothetical protein